MNKINALAESDITKEYAKPTTPNRVPRDKIPEINIIIEITLVITIIPLFSFAKNCAEYNVDIVVLLFANNPAISIELAKKGIKKLKNNSSYDSAFSVCKYNMFSPARARKLKNNQIKFLIPYRFE